MTDPRLDAAVRVHSGREATAAGVRRNAVQGAVRRSGCEAPSNKGLVPLLGGPASRRRESFPDDS